MGIGRPSSHNRGHISLEFPRTRWQCQQDLVVADVVLVDLLLAALVWTSSNGRLQALLPMVQAPIPHLPCSNVDATDEAAWRATAAVISPPCGHPRGLLDVAVVAPTH